jgi:hypothetical protein
MDPERLEAFSHLGGIRGSFRPTVCGVGGGRKINIHMGENAYNDHLCQDDKAWPPSGQMLSRERQY